MPVSDAAGGDDVPRAPTQWMVAGIRRYPVKSMVGQELDRADLGVRGVAGDRRWAVVDAGTGVALSAKRHPVLLQCRARIVEAAVGTLVDGGGGAPRVRIRLPDGVEVSSDEAEGADRHLSALLGRPVRLSSAGSARVRTEFPDDAAGGSGSPDPSTPTQVVSGLRGIYADGAPVHLLTQPMLERVAGGDPSRALVDRYRPNLVLARPVGAPVAGAAEHGDTSEDVWTGRRLQVGHAVVEVTAACPRCAMIGMQQPGVARDRGLLRDVVRRHDGVVGVYAIVRRPGGVRVGDPVRSVGPAGRAAAGAAAGEEGRS